MSQDLGGVVDIFEQQVSVLKQAFDANLSYSDDNNIFFSPSHLAKMKNAIETDYIGSALTFLDSLKTIYSSEVRDDFDLELFADQLGAIGNSLQEFALKNLIPLDVMRTCVQCLIIADPSIEVTQDNTAARIVDLAFRAPNDP